MNYYDYMKDFLEFMNLGIKDIREIISKKDNITIEDLTRIKYILECFLSIEETAISNTKHTILIKESDILIEVNEFLHM